MAQSPHRVVVVDAEVDARTFCRQVIEDLEYEAHEASSVEEALALVRTCRPHLVLVSWCSLPEPAEDSLSELISVGGRRAPQLLVTCEGERGEEVGARVKLLGVDLVLVKPLDTGLLRLAVEGAMALVTRSGAWEVADLYEDDDEAYGDQTVREPSPADTLQDDVLAAAAIAAAASGTVIDDTAAVSGGERRAAWRAARDEGDPWDDETSHKPLDLDALAAEEAPRSEWADLEGEETARVPTMQSWQAEALGKGAPGPAELAPKRNPFEDLENERTSPWLRAKFVEVQRQERGAGTDGGDGDPAGESGGYQIVLGGAPDRRSADGHVRDEAAQRAQRPSSPPVELTGRPAPRVPRSKRPTGEIIEIPAPPEPAPAPPSPEPVPASSGPATPESTSASAAASDGDPIEQKLAARAVATRTRPGLGAASVAGAAPPSPLASGQEESARRDGRLPSGGLPPPAAIAGPVEEANGPGAILWGAYRCLVSGKPRAALGMIRLLATMEPDNPGFHLYLGWATYKANRKQVKLAERCLLEASRLDRSAPEPFVLMAEICSLEGDLERARKFEAKGRRLTAEREPSDAGILGADEADIKREMQRAMKDYVAQERADKAPKQRKSGILRRLLKGK